MSELSQGQKDHWEKYLEDSERAVELALRTLGRLPVEKEVEQNNE